MSLSLETYTFPFLYIGKHCGRSSSNCNFSPLVYMVHAIFVPIVLQVSSLQLILFISLFSCMELLYTDLCGGIQVNHLLKHRQIVISTYVRFFFFPFCLRFILNLQQGSKLYFCQVHRKTDRLLCY